MKIYWCILAGVNIFNKNKLACLRCGNTNLIKVKDNVVQCLNCGKLFHVIVEKKKEILEETNKCNLNKVNVG